MTPTDSKEYARELLRLNPCVSAQQIVQHRARYLGIEKAPRQGTGADVDLPERRHRAEEALTKIRSDFWTVMAPESESRLAALNFEGLPDLAASAARLARAAQASAEFSRLGGERGVNQSFVEALRQIVVLPPAAAGQMKQRQERTCVGWRALRSTKRTIRLITKKYPQIYELENEWLDHVASLRWMEQAKSFPRSYKQPSPREAQPGKQNRAILIWAVFIIVSIILRMLASK